MRYASDFDQLPFRISEKPVRRLRADEQISFALVYTTPSKEAEASIELVLAGGERL